MIGGREWGVGSRPVAAIYGNQRVRGRFSQDHRQTGDQDIKRKPGNGILYGQIDFRSIAS